MIKQQFHQVLVLNATIYYFQIKVNNFLNWDCFHNVFLQTYNWHV